MTDGGVCRTAPATPGLLIINFKILLDLQSDSFDRNLLNLLNTFINRVGILAPPLYLTNFQAAPSLTLLFVYYKNYPKELGAPQN
jgi:hypothetical protein